MELFFFYFFFGNTQVCLEPFTGKGIPPSRRDAILSYIGGNDLVKLIKPGQCCSLVVLSSLFFFLLLYSFSHTY